MPEPDAFGVQENKLVECQEVPRLKRISVTLVFSDVASILWLHDFASFALFFFLPKVPSPSEVNCSAAWTSHPLQTSQ